MSWQPTEIRLGSDRFQSQTRSQPPAACPATIAPLDAAQTPWDVIVIGAGPGGALAARQMSQLGLRTLLIDKGRFPRAKVCGGCISGEGSRVLHELELGHLVEPPSAIPLDRFVLAGGGKPVSFALPLGAAVSRSQFDTDLVREAVACGAEFLPETTVVVRGLTDGCRFRSVELSRPNREMQRARSRLVVVADGLGRTSLKQHHSFRPRIAVASRVGLGATISGGNFELEPGVVSMCVGRDGYVGMVRISGDAIDLHAPVGELDDGVNVAAAVDPNVLRQRGPAGAVREILLQAGIAVPQAIDRADWRGTGLLTRPCGRVAGKRLVLLGDAAGYVEPFTGEGMTWAMRSAAALAPLAAEWLGGDDQPVARSAAASQQALAAFSILWTRQHASLVASRQRSCRILAHLLRHPTAVRSAMVVLSRFPRIAMPLVRYFWNPSPRASKTSPRVLNSNSRKRACRPAVKNGRKPLQRVASATEATQTDSAAQRER